MVNKTANKILNAINLYQYRNGKWVLEITVNGNLNHLVSFNNLNDALMERTKIEEDLFLNKSNDEELIKK